MSELSRMAYEPIVIEVIGIPAPQGSKSAVIRGGKARVIEGSSPGMRERHKSWREGVAQGARDWLRDHAGATIYEPVGIVVTFYFTRPASDRFRVRHKSQPDLDKLLRSTFDGLVYGGLLHDDGLITAVKARKVYTDERPGAVIQVWPLGREEAADREQRKADARDRRKLLT